MQTLLFFLEVPGTTLAKPCKLPVLKPTCALLQAAQILTLPISTPALSWTTAHATTLPTPPRRQA